MRMTSKGQVTIPKDIRDKLGIGPGSDIGFAEDGGQVVLVNNDEKSGESDGAILVRQLKELGARARREGFWSGLTTDEIMEMTRGPLDDVKPR
jgi:AbrB family looped-hinge helix DNA binding protein